MKTKKVIILLVEGITEKIALEGVASKCFDTNTTVFQIVHGDILTKSGNNSSVIIKKINEHIKANLSKNRLKHSDIKQIIHLIDTDGAYIPDGNVIYSESDNTVEYSLNNILTNKVDKIIETKQRKYLNTNKLIGQQFINKTPYKIYFFSRNLEHVLYDISKTCSKNEKTNLAEKFADKYKNDENGFLQFINSNEFAVSGTYEETWDFIKKDCNSLNKYSNMHLCFELVEK